MSVVINKQCLLWLWDRELVTHMPHICPCGLANTIQLCYMDQYWSVSCLK